MTLEDEKKSGYSDRLGSKEKERNPGTENSVRKCFQTSDGGGPSEGEGEGPETVFNDIMILPGPSPLACLPAVPAIAVVPV